MNNQISEIKALIFDVDGVLFETEPLHRLAWMEVLSEYGMEVSEDSLYRWTGIPCQTVSRHYTKLINQERQKGKNGIKEELNWPEIFDKKEARLKKIAEERLEMAEGLESFLERQKGRFQLAYATSNNRDMIDHFFDITGADRYFSTGVTYEDVSETKPSPEPYEKALELLELDACKVIALEDSASGIASAGAAGIRSLGIANTISAERLQEALRVFPNLRSALKWLESHVSWAFDIDRENDKK